MKFTTIAKKLHKSVDNQLKVELKNYDDAVEDKDMIDMFTQDAKDCHEATDILATGDMPAFIVRIGNMDSAASDQLGYLLAEIADKTFWNNNMETAGWSSYDQIINPLF